MTTPTPRTDAHCRPTDEDGTDWVHANFARQLERDLAAAQEANAQLVKERDAAFAMSKCECQSEECCRNLVAAQEARQAAEKERDDANDKAVRVLRGEFAQICSYCGWEAFDGTADAEPEAAWNMMQSHVKECGKHPLRAAEQRAQAAEARAEEYRKAAIFAGKVMAECRDSLADLDGGWLQDTMTDCGMLECVTLPGSCGEECRCDESARSDEERECYRLTEAARAAIAEGE